MPLCIPLKGVSLHAYEQMCRKGAPAISLKTLKKKMKNGRARAQEAQGGRKAVIYENFVYILGFCKSDGVVSVLTDEEYRNQKSQEDY